MKLSVCNFQIQGTFGFSLYVKLDGKMFTDFGSIFLRAVVLSGTPSERFCVCLRGKLRISMPTVLFAQSQSDILKIK